MKKLFKVILSLFVLFIMLHSCKDDDNSPVNNNLSTTQGHWKLNTDHNTNKSTDTYNVFFEFDGNYMNVYLQENDSSPTIIIEKYPASQSGNKIYLYDPFENDVIISEIELDTNNNFLNRNASYNSNSFNKINNESSKTNYFICQSCRLACYAVHEALGISELDGICCFYLDCSQ